MDPVFYVPLGLFVVAFVLALIALSMTGWLKQLVSLLCAISVVCAVVALFARVEPKRVETALAPSKEDD